MIKAFKLISFHKLLLGLLSKQQKINIMASCYAGYVPDTFNVYLSLGTRRQAREAGSRVGGPGAGPGWSRGARLLRPLAEYLHISPPRAASDRLPANKD